MKLDHALQAIAVTVSLGFASVGISTTIAAQAASASSIQDVIFVNNNTRDSISLQVGSDRMSIPSGITATYRVRGNTKLCLENAIVRTKQECFAIKGGRSYTVIRSMNGSVKLIQAADTFVVRNFN